MEENIFRFSDGIMSACKTLGLKLPMEVPSDSGRYPMPSDYLGKEFELDEGTIARLKKRCRLSDETYDKLYNKFRRFYRSQKIFKYNQTDLSVLFCDYVMTSRKNGYNIPQYFLFGFWRKSVAEQKTFIGSTQLSAIRAVCNDFSSFKFAKNKALANRTFAEFIRRDWIDLSRSSLEQFRLFIAKHPKFFTKTIEGRGGLGARVFSIDETFDVEDFYQKHASGDLIVEEILQQHPSLAEFCPDTLNTIRINSLLDIHGTARIITAVGRFGRVGKVVDNFPNGGFIVEIDPITGVIVSDGINIAQERVAKHPDSGKKFRGFQYPCWGKLRAMVLRMAKVVPTLRHIGWDIAINAAGEPELVEANSSPGVGIQQAAASIGRLNLYQSFVEELEQHDRERLERIGYSVNNIDDFESSYQMTEGNLRNRFVGFALEELIEGCASVIDVGCRADKFVKTLLPTEIKYYPVDFHRYDDSNVERESVESEAVEHGTVEREAVERPTVDDETIVCDFNSGVFPDLTADTVLSIYTAEFVETLPEFLDNICRAARRQVLMVCRPIDKERHRRYRWAHPFTTDFTEKYLIDSVSKNGFVVNLIRTDPINRSVVLYDFRRK